MTAIRFGALRGLVFLHCGIVGQLENWPSQAVFSSGVAFLSLHFTSSSPLHPNKTRLISLTITLFRAGISHYPRPTVAL